MFLTHKNTNCSTCTEFLLTPPLLLTKTYSAMKESLFSSLIEHGYSDQVLLGLLSTDLFLTITTNYVR